MLILFVLSKMTESDRLKAAAIQEELLNCMPELEEFYKTIENKPQHMNRAELMKLLFALLKKE